MTRNTTPSFLCIPYQLSEDIHSTENKYFIGPVPMVKTVALPYQALNHCMIKCYAKYLTHCVSHIHSFLETRKVFNFI